MVPSQIQTQHLKVFYWIALFVWASFIFTLSHQSTLPGPAEPTFDFIFKKLAHITVYAIFYWLTLSALTTTYPKATKNWFVAFVITLLYAISDEYHQSFIIGRTAALRDIGFDLIGATIAFLRWHRYI